VRTVQGSEAEESATPNRLSLIFWREVEWSGACFGMNMSQDRERILALHQRSFDFTCGVIDAHPKSRGVDDPSRLIWRQLIKAASSATFNLEEADAASSDNDFLAKMRIALREAKESHVGIRNHCPMPIGRTAAPTKLSRRSTAARSNFRRDYRQRKGGHGTQPPFVTFTFDF
jgi:hypothetical protein